MNVEFKIRGISQHSVPTPKSAPVKTPAMDVNYKVNFSNMFANLAMTKKGCGSCRGTF